MGSADSFVYLASPAVVAASALKGWIAAPDGAAAGADAGKGTTAAGAAAELQQKLQAAGKISPACLTMIFFR